MNTSLDVTLVGGVLSHDVRSGVSQKTGQPYRITEVTVLTPSLDKVTVAWPDAEQVPADGEGIAMRCRVSTRAGVGSLDVRCSSWRRHELTGILAAAMTEVVAPADVPTWDDSEQAA